MAYSIDYSPEAEDHLQRLTARHRKTVMDTVDRQLHHEPTTETRNRKPMRPNPVAPWELRIGSLRVYYEVEEEPEPRVCVLAVGIKVGSKVRIGREIVEL